MKSTTTATLLAASLIMGACASTPESGAAPADPAEAPAEKFYGAQSQAEAAAGEDDLICRNERVLGSRFPKKTCATRSEWEAARSSAQDEMRRNQKGTALQKN